MDKPLPLRTGSYLVQRPVLSHSEYMINVTIFSPLASILSLGNLRERLGGR
jgi:hypothetical protein